MCENGTDQQMVQLHDDGDDENGGQKTVDRLMFQTLKVGDEINMTY